MPIDEHSCMLHLGAENPQVLAYLLVVLGVDFTVESPPGFVGHLRTVAERFTRAAESTERSPPTGFNRRDDDPSHEM